MSFDTSLMSISQSTRLASHAYGHRRIASPRTTRLGLVLEMVADSSDRVEPICQQAFVVQCQSWKRENPRAATRNSTLAVWWRFCCLPADRSIFTFRLVSRGSRCEIGSDCRSIPADRERKLVNQQPADSFLLVNRPATSASQWTVAAAKTCQSASARMTARLLFSKETLSRSPLGSLCLSYFALLFSHVRFFVASALERSEEGDVLLDVALLSC